ncbi:hypothetical protein VCRA2113O23_30398 [Vibrio crassostreae]|nr:hypothetical protein VCRA2113O23_30398 [Vibrio crassostreae]
MIVGTLAVHLIVALVVSTSPAPGVGADGCAANAVVAMALTIRPDKIFFFILIPAFSINLL